MSARFIIRRHNGIETARLSRDVRDEHPAWVHEQLGTESESQLQSFLDQCDPFAYAGKEDYDADGIRLADPQLRVIGDLDGPDEDCGIVCRVTDYMQEAYVAWDTGVSTWTPITNLTID